MQLYIKPYQYQTFVDVNYNAEKQNDLKLKDITELTTLIERINQSIKMTIYSYNEGIDLINDEYVQVWSVISFHFDDLIKNKTEEEYLKLIGDFLHYAADDNEENAVVEFISIPTNYHVDETTMFQGWSLMCKVVGIGTNNIEARGLWQYGIDKVAHFLI